MLVQDPDEQQGGEDEGLPLGQLVALRQDGSTTPAAMKARARQAAREAKAAKEAAAAGGGGADGGGGGGKHKRGKHRPQEMSSKRPVPVLRETLQGGKR